MTWRPKSGDVVYLTRAASVQFIEPIFFRVIRVLDDWVTYDGWMWLDGYQLNTAGEATERRSLFVLIGGVRRMPAKSDDLRPGARRTIVRSRGGNRG